MKAAIIFMTILGIACYLFPFWTPVVALTGMIISIVFFTLEIILTAIRHKNRQND